MAVTEELHGEARADWLAQPAFFRFVWQGAYSAGRLFFVTLQHRWAKVAQILAQNANSKGGLVASEGVLASGQIRRRAPLAFRDSSGQPCADAQCAATARLGVEAPLLGPTCGPQRFVPERARSVPQHWGQPNMAGFLFGTRQQGPKSGTAVMFTAQALCQHRLADGWT